MEGDVVSTAPWMPAGVLREARKLFREQTAWSLKWRSENRLDGKCEYLMASVRFDTRRQAREYLSETYGYLRDRPDLTREPHGWKMPKVVKVRVVVEEL